MEVWRSQAGSEREIETVWQAHLLILICIHSPQNFHFVTAMFWVFLLFVFFFFSLGPHQHRMVKADFTGPGLYSKIILPSAFLFP